MTGQTLYQLDRPQLQVSIDATIAEITTLNDTLLKYGVQYFVQTRIFGLKPDSGSVDLVNSATSAVLSRVLPGFNFLLGSCVPVDDVGIRVFQLHHHANFHLAAAGQTLCRGKYAFRCFRIERLGERVANEDWCEPNTRRGNFEKFTSGNILSNAFLHEIL